MKKGLLELDAEIQSAASVVGQKEYDGPIGSCFDLHGDDDRFGKKTWEKAESEMQRLALNTALAKGEFAESDIDTLFAGDLLNQCIGSAYGLIDFNIPYFGLYGACSTAAEGLLLASVLVSAGFATRTCAVTSSHNCSAERQYRTPIEYGGQRPQTAQWTVTGSGAFVVGRTTGRGLARVTGGMPGIVVEKGITDANNMGAAMAPAAANTIRRYFEATGDKPGDYDCILTGDLGYEGGSILCDLLLIDGIDIRGVYADCGQIIYDRKAQDMHAGGSGCGCSAVVLASYFLPRIRRGDLRRVLFLGTGAMMSPDSIKQGGAIPGIAHLLRLETGGKERG